MAPAAKLVADREAMAMLGRTWLWWHAQLQREGAREALAQAMSRHDGDQTAMPARLPLRAALWKNPPLCPA